MKILVKILAIGQALLLPGAALAQKIPTPPPVRLFGGTLADVLTNVSNGILGIAGVIAVVVLIVGGFQYASAAGNEDQIANAKKTITYAVIGLVIVALALVIVNTIRVILPR